MKSDPEILDKRNLWFVITASSVGTLIEWYDFYIFGSLATILSEQFFPKTNPTVGLLSTLATFAVGFIVRAALTTASRSAACGSVRIT